MREGGSNRAWEDRTPRSLSRPRNAGLLRVLSQDPLPAMVMFGEPV